MEISNAFITFYEHKLRTPPYELKQWSNCDSLGSDL